jgi:hypothetical protein
MQDDGTPEGACATLNILEPLFHTSCQIGMTVGTADQQGYFWDTSVNPDAFRLYAFDATDFNFNDSTQTVTLGSQVSELGLIGQCTDFEGTGQDGIDASCTFLELPKGTAPSSSMFDNADDEGKFYMETDAPTGDPLLVVHGTTIQSAAGRYLALGGDGSDGAFTFNGAADTTCNGGTVTGSSPNKICTLTSNSAIARFPVDSGTTLYSCEYNFSSFTLTGGTVTCGVASAPAVQAVPTWGYALVLRVSGAWSVTGGTIDMAGRGTWGGVGGTGTGTGTGRAGGNGGGNSFFPFGAAGANTGTAGGAGQQPPAALRVWPMLPFFVPMGMGGGGGASTGTAGGIASSLALATYAAPIPFIAGTGGGGGGCSSSATSGTGTDGGRGGGAIWIETPTYTCSGATMTVAGVNAGASPAAAGGGGGGGGGIVIVGRDLTGTDSCTYTTTAGNGVAAGQGQCGAGGNGGAGRKWTFTAPQ